MTIKTYNKKAHRFTNININFILEKHHSRQHVPRHKAKPCKYIIYDIVSTKLFNYKTINTVWLITFLVTSRTMNSGQRINSTLKLSFRSQLTQGVTR